MIIIINPINCIKFSSISILSNLFQALHTWFMRCKTFPANIYLLQVRKRNPRNRCKICSKLTIKTQEWRQWGLVVSLLLTLNRFFTLFWLFHYWLWTSKCWLWNNLFPHHLKERTLFVNLLKQPSKGVLKFHKIHRKTPVKFLRTSFFIEYLWWLLLNLVQHNY